MSFENWERGTRNASGAKVRTYTSDLPRLRMSTPRSGFVPFQYEKAYGVKNAVGFRMAEKCTQAKIPAWSRKNDFAAVHAATGRKLPENVAAALFVAIAMPTSKRAVRNRRHAINVLRDFCTGENHRATQAAMIAFSRDYATVKVCGENAATPATVAILVDGLRRAGYAIVKPARPASF